MLGSDRPLSQPPQSAACPERQHHVKNHAHTGHGLALERAAQGLEINNCVSLRQRLRGKMMIGDQNLTADLFGRLNTATLEMPLSTVVIPDSALSLASSSTILATSRSRSRSDWEQYSQRDESRSPARQRLRAHSWSRRLHRSHYDQNAVDDPPQPANRRQSPFRATARRNKVRQCQVQFLLTGKASLPVDPLQQGVHRCGKC